MAAQAQPAFDPKALGDGSTASRETLGAVDRDRTLPLVLAPQHRPAISRLIGGAEAQVAARGEVASGTRCAFERASLTRNREALRTLAWPSRTRWPRSGQHADWGGGRRVKRGLFRVGLRLNTRGLAHARPGLALELRDRLRLAGDAQLALED